MFPRPLHPAICDKAGVGGGCLEQDAEETVWTKEAGNCREWRKLYNEKPYDLCCSQNIVGLMGWVEGEMGGMRHSEMHFWMTLFRRFYFFLWKFNRIVRNLNRPNDTVFWDVTPCSLVEIRRLLEERVVSVFRVGFLFQNPEGQWSS